jgi:type IVB pilus formation R64 PilN family outer membrane protein
MVHPGHSSVAPTRRRLSGLATRQSRELAPRALHIHSGYYFGSGRPIPLIRSHARPPVFHETVTFVTRHLYLYQLIDRISELSGLPVRLGALLEQQQSKNGQQETQRALLRATGRVMRISYRGVLSGLLDKIAAHYGLSWRWWKGAIRFFRYETRVFTLAVLPGSMGTSLVLTNQSDLGSQGGATGGASETSSQTVTQAQHNNFWSRLVANLKSMLTLHGVVFANPEAGTVTVTDRPMILGRVGRYLASVNRVMQREVSVSVRVYSLDLTNAALRSFNLNVVFDNLAQTYGVTLTGASPVSSVGGAATLSATLLDTATGRIGQYAGSHLLVEALSQYGHVALLTQGSGIALQGQPLPIQVTKTVGYLASAQTTASTLVGQSTALTPGEVTTGFSMIVVPRIMAGRELAMQYAIDLATLNSLTTITSGGESIQVPSVSSQRFVQRVIMRSGQTLVLAGFEQVEESRQGDQGLLSWFSGHSQQRKMIFVTLTARRIRV